MKTLSKVSFFARATSQLTVILFGWFGLYAKAYSPPTPTVPIPSTPISTIGDFYKGLCAVTQWIMVFGLIIGVAFIIYGGVRYITSGGDEKKAGDAKKTILTALIGVVFLILAVALVRIIASFFGSVNFSTFSLLTC